MTYFGISIIVFSVFSNITVARVSAVSTLFCETNSVLYGGCSSPCTAESNSGGAKSDSQASTGNWDGSASDGLTDEQAAFVDENREIAQKLSVEYGIPWETVVAQGILESGAGTSEYARERNNFFGIGAFDANPDNAYSFATPEEGWRGYYQNIVDTPTYRNHGVFQGNTVTDPYAYAQAIKDAGYATDPDYVSKVSKFVRAVEVRSGEKGWESSADLAKKNPGMLSSAEKNAAGASSSSGPTQTGGSTSTSFGCSSGSGNGPVLSAECKEVVDKMNELIGSGVINITEESTNKDLENCNNDFIANCTPGARATTLRGIIAGAQNSGVGTIDVWNINEAHGCDQYDHPNGLATDIGACGGQAANSDSEECKKLFDYYIAHMEELGIKYIIWNGSYCQNAAATKEHVSCRGDHSDHIHMSFKG